MRAVEVVAAVSEVGRGVSVGALDALDEPVVALYEIEHDQQDKYVRAARNWTKIDSVYGLKRLSVVELWIDDVVSFGVNEPILAFDIYHRQSFRK